VAFVQIAASPLAPGESAVHLRYRESGAGRPVVLLHGGWGYDIYPFDRQIDALQSTHRIVAPDRTGYGGSGALRALPPDFHRRAAGETLALLDALGIERPVVWGHSDGAVIALQLGLMAPGRVGGIIAEATHFFRRKPASREFFETMRDEPAELGERVASVLARDHGERWQSLIQMAGAAWLRIAEQGGDLYDGRLGELRVPVLVIHGARDPRTEPGELDALRQALGIGSGVPALPAAPALPVSPVQFIVLPEGGHSPHSERATSDEVTRIATAWLAEREGGGT
jgi:pimeloyl-ACP methyl ester carboxylesterase